jgi:hypothetical protein
MAAKAMTTEETQRMYGYIAKYLPPDTPTDLILAEKLGRTILAMGDTLAKNTADLEQARLDLQIQHDKRAEEAKARKPTKKLKQRKPSKQPATIIAEPATPVSAEFPAPVAVTA